MKKKTDKELAYAFIKKLDSARYTGLDVQCASGETVMESMDEDLRENFPLGYPRTLDKAFNLASSFTVTVLKSNKQKPMLASSLVTTKKTDPGPSKKLKHNEKDKSGSKWCDLSKVKATDDPTKWGLKKCPCGEKHFRKFCPTNGKKKADDTKSEDGEESDSEKETKKQSKKKKGKKSFANAVTLSQQEYEEEQDNSTPPAAPESTPKSKRARMSVTLLRRILLYAQKLGFGK